MTGSWQQASQLVPESPGSLMLPAALSDKEKSCPSPKALSHISRPAVVTEPETMGIGLWTKGPARTAMISHDLPSGGLHSAETL